MKKLIAATTAALTLLAGVATVVPQKSATNHRQLSPYRKGIHEAPLYAAIKWTI